MGDSTDGDGQPATDADAPWEPYFGFDNPYRYQSDAIEAAIAAGEENGFLAMEAPCGTGKTMAALTAAAYLIRDRQRYENIFIVTPVKQQLDQFVADLRTLNRGLDDPLTGVALVGKADLCPYEREGVFPDDIGVHERCEDLRESTAALVTGDPTDGGRMAKLHRLRDPADRWWDPAVGAELSRHAHWSSSDAALQTADATAPYIRHQPTAPTADGEDGPLYCPFEADWYARDTGSPVGFDDGVDNVITIGEFLPAAVDHGSCPHRVMTVLFENADVVIGNYNHLFDPRTRSLTAAILDERTFVIVDEAHRLEERVRSLLSDRIGRRTLQQAIGDLDLVTRFAAQDPANRNRVDARLSAYDVDLRAIERVVTFLESVIDWLDDRIDRHMVTEYGWPRTGQPPPDAIPEEDLEIPLRDPETSDRDDLSTWAVDRGFDAGFFRSIEPIGAAAVAVIQEIDQDRTPVCAGVCARFAEWWTRDTTDYFREIVLRYAPREQFQRELSHPWREWYTPGLVLYNCIPARELRTMFDSVGGGILMSATLEPLDVFRVVSGLDHLADDRPVTERRYPLSFPPEHRASWIVDVPAFTASNRGPPDDDTDNAVREAYAYVGRIVARSPGNVLLCLPNYREARWLANRLRESCDKPILLDEPSSNETTSVLREQFFTGGASVLVTSTRGTLTEGVDYDGEKLSTCAVIGVPIVNIGSPRTRAVKHAYGVAFGSDNAFEYALTVPAVRRVRQAIGRVIRGPDERGVRILVGNRYTDAARHTVLPYFPASERDEFIRMTPMFLEDQLVDFWDS